MAYVVKRGSRYTAYTRIDGKIKSLGTFNSRAKATQIGLLAQENALDILPDNQPTLKEYIEQLMTRKDLRVITKKTYLILLKKYAINSLGARKLNSIKRKDIANLLASLKDNGVGVSTISHLKTALGYVFREAVDDELIQQNPTHRIQVKVPQPDPTHALEPKDFSRIQSHLPSTGARLLARFLIGSGCRYGEATELRVKDFNFSAKEVYVRRSVSDVGKSYGNGDRFIVVSATKNYSKRTIVLSASLIAEIKAFVEAKALPKESLVFSKQLVMPADKIEFPQKGKQYQAGSRTFQHGTPYSYNMGGCRCEQCKKAIKAYRSHYRKDKAKAKVGSHSKSHSKSQSNSRSHSKSNSESHLPRDKWRAIWNEAINKSGIGWYPTTHDLRHANATHLLKSGVDVHEVKERLGHQSIVTTERYLHRIRHQQSKAAEVVNDYLE